jgi:uncharacterized membrane protein required for colicin V production
VNDPGGRIKRGVFVLAAVLLAGLAALRYLGIDRALLGVLAGAAGLLVAALLVTYRAFAGVAETARRTALEQPPPADADEDEDDR